MMIMMLYNWNFVQIICRSILTTERQTDQTNEWINGVSQTAILWTDQTQKKDKPEKNTSRDSSRWGKKIHQNTRCAIVDNILVKFSPENISFKSKINFLLGLFNNNNNNKHDKYTSLHAKILFSHSHSFKHGSIHILYMKKNAEKYPKFQNSGLLSYRMVPALL